MPQDPFSTIARTLIEVRQTPVYKSEQSQNKPPQFDRIEAFETPIIGGGATLSIDVYVKYQNRILKAHNYVFPYNPDEAESSDFF